MTLDRIKIARYADNRKEALTRKYDASMLSMVAAVNSDAPLILSAALSGLALAQDKLIYGGIAALEKLVTDHERTNRLWQNALAWGELVVVGDAPVSAKRAEAHTIEIHEMRRMLKFAHRMHGMNIASAEVLPLKRRARAI